MGAFNILNVKITCPNCHADYVGRIQFKFGETWQIEYEIGDKIKWGLNNKGKPDLEKVYVYGILENDGCPICSSKNIESEYDLIVKNDVVTSVRPMQDHKIYHMVEDQNYAIPKD